VALQYSRAESKKSLFSIGWMRYFKKMATKVAVQRTTKRRSVCKTGVEAVVRFANDGIISKSHRCKPADWSHLGSSPSFLRVKEWLAGGCLPPKGECCNEGSGFPRGLVLQRLLQKRYETFVCRPRCLFRSCCI
jgi:hypothetical protein